MDFNRGWDSQKAMQELPSAYKPTDGDCHDRRAHRSRNDKEGKFMRNLLVPAPGG